MLRYFFLLAFVHVLSIGQAQSAKDGAVLDAEQARFDAMTRRDTNYLKDVLSDDLIYVHSNALTETKQQHIQAILTGKIIYEKMTREPNTTVRRYGKMALTNGIVGVKGQINGTAFDIRIRYAATYRKHKKLWQLVNWQSTRMN